jgi:hypothetical protein
MERVGAVGFGVSWIVMDFEKEAVDAGGDGGARKQGNEFGLAAADAASSGGLLNGVGGVKDDRGEVAHDGEGAEIDDQGVVAEAGAALGEEDALVAGGTDFFEGIVHVPGGDELAFFDVDGAAGLSRGEEQVGLPAKEGGDLQNVGGLGRDFAMGRFVDVSEDRQGAFPREAAEDAHALGEAGAAKAVHAGAVCLVVAGFEDEGNAEIGGDALDGIGHGAHMGFAFDDAWAGDEKKTAAADMDRPNFEGIAHYADCNHARNPGSRNRSPIY